MGMTNRSGFTMIEILVAMAVAGIVGAAIFLSYEAQVRTKVSQEVSLEMQQGARAAFERMTSEIRMAGCDPTSKSDARILAATPAEIVFSFDIADDGGVRRSDGDVCDTDEVVRYHLTSDVDENGFADGSVCHLGRETGPGISALSPPCGNTRSGLQAIALNIEALNFVYLNAAGNVIAAPVNTDDIRSIQVTIVARSGETMRGLLHGYNDTTVYRNQQGITILPAQNDKFRRLRLTTTINCRNLEG